MRRIAIYAMLCTAALVGITQRVFGQETKISTEDQFHELFITAGYSTAFGAALGAAVLGLQSDPSGKLGYIAVGASLGFIVGSFLGSYIVLAPSFSETVEPGPRGAFALDTVRSNHREAFAPNAKAMAGTLGLKVTF